MEKNNVYIDQLRVTNFTVVSLGDDDNINNLIEEGVLVIHIGAKVYCYTDSGIAFSTLKIKDKNAPFDELYVSVTKGFKRQMYNISSLSLSVQHGEYGNVIGYSLQEYKDKINECETYLQKSYGITMDFSSLDVKIIELNHTFELEHEFNKYSRVLRYIEDSLPPYFNTVHSYKENKENTGFLAATYKKNDSKSYESIKVYNKTRQLKKKFIRIDKKLMRIEIRVVGFKAIKRNFKTVNLNELDEEKLNNYYLGRIKQIKDKIAQTDKKNLIKIKKKISYERENHRNTWTHNVLRWLQTEENQRGVPVILDIHNMDSTIDKVIDKPNRRYDIKKRIQKNASNHEYNFCQRDDLKLQEILEKFEGKNDFDLRLLP